MNFTKDRLKKTIVNQFFLHLLSFVTLIFSVVCYYSNFTDYNFDNSFNSDSVGVPYLFKDIFHDGGHFKDWKLASAPTLFPDMVLYYLLYQFLELDFLTITIWFAIIQVLAIAGLSCFVFRKLVPGRSKEFSWLVPLFYSIIFFEGYYYTGDQILPFLISTYCFHTGTFVNALIALSILVTDIKYVWKIVFLFLISSLAMYSDMMYAVAFIGPLFALTIFQPNFFGWKRSLVFFLTVLIGGASGYYLFYSITSSGDINYASNSNLFHFENITNSYNVMSNHILWYLDRPGFMTALVGFMLLAIPLSLLVVIILYKKLDKRIRYFLIFYFVFMISTMFAPVLMGNYPFVDCIRYNSSMYFFTTVGMSFFVAVAFGKFIRSEYVGKIVSYLVIFMFMYMSLARFKTNGLNNYFSYYPPKVRAIDSICDKNQLKKGISDYWKAKHTSIFSRKGITMVTVHASLNFYEVGSNINWFYKGDYDFVVPENLDTAEIRKYFVILDTFETEQIIILKVDKFKYVPDKLFPVQVSTGNYK
ncbi:MAG: hypothetical protein SGJ15_05540 [Bacteroidota bacterium]|nr:hypothetical protein [Bacteroidota bacterium]